MFTFIWQRVDNATTSWHPEAGIVAIAPSLEEARAAIALHTVEVKKPCEALTLPPDDTYPCDAPAKVYIFPDAGCC